MSGGAGPGTARVDSYTFFTEVSTAGAQPTPGSGTIASKTIFEINLGQNRFVGLYGECSECLDFGCGGEIQSTANGASIQYATSLPSAAGSEGRGGSGSFSQEGYVLLAETLSPDPELGGPHLGTGVRVLNLIGSHVRAKVEIAATVNGERPALCTFSGTVDIIRAR